jgi:carbon storage regulator CsrA
MLVLTRKLQEKIQIGDNITITILRTKGKSVRLGIEAPMEVPVIRGELSFDAQPAEQPLHADLAAAPVSIAPLGSRTPQSKRTATGWAAQGRPHLMNEAAPGQESTRVSHQRISREKVSELLGALPGVNGGPLRAMIDRRSLTA